MTFTSDEERREIAENLRREILYTRGSLGDWWMRLHEAVTGSEDFPCPQETMAAIADLIDRPTCTIVHSWQEITPGLDELDLSDMCGFELSCGHEVQGYEKPKYCSECGAVVLNAD